MELTPFYRNRARSNFDRDRRDASAIDTNTKPASGAELTARARFVDDRPRCSWGHSEVRRPANRGHDAASDGPGFVIGRSSSVSGPFETTVTLTSTSRNQKKADDKPASGLSGSRSYAPPPSERAAWHRESPAAHSALLQRRPVLRAAPSQRAAVT